MEENYVEAIEEGKIVRVSEKYARQEELPILKRAKINQVETGQQLTKLGIARKREEYLRKLKEPSNWRKSQVASELIDNFQWIITKERKKRGLTKKQFAKAINEDEEVVKLLEYGIMPSQDFVIINKIQQALGINLRKDGKDFSVSPRTLIEKPEKEISEFHGNEIEIFEDE